ncbi:hypothetical protein CDV55_106235 [Aspergillus turcosus]|nr:hypothetical protein CDV55_106235 [Aspergillus turcosus]
MEKPIRLSQSRRRQCWECHRRRLVCDFSLPGCHKCYTAGVECPGYDEKKPLKWVTSGEVTSRPRKKTVQQTTTKQHVSEDRGDSQVEAWSLSVPRDRLVIEFEAIVEAAYYYNTCVLPEYTCLLQLAENPFITAFPMESLQGIPPPIHCTIVSLALSHRFHRLLPQNSRSDLREIEAKHYQHRGQAIRYLKEEIGRPDKCRTDKTLVGVMMLLFSDSRQSTSPNWRHHFTGALELITLRGGVEKLLHSAPHLKALLLIGVISNTTSPPSDHIPLGSDIRSIDVISQMYGDGFFPVLLCPPALLANILQINHLRLQAFLHPTTEYEAKALELLGRITAFSPEQWAMSCGAPEKGIILGHVYRSAVILYCILSLQSLSVLPRMAQLRTLIEAHTKELFTYLKLACGAPGIGKCMLWPLVVAGVCAQGDLAMQQFVDRQLSALGTDIGTPVPLLATVVFRNFWETAHIPAGNQSALLDAEAIVDQWSALMILAVSILWDCGDLGSGRRAYYHSIYTVQTAMATGQIIRDEHAVSAYQEELIDLTLTATPSKSLCSTAFLPALLAYFACQQQRSIFTMRWNRLLHLAFAPLAAAQISFSPASDIHYSVIVPESTVSSNSGPIYFQIHAPTSYQWVALGQGSGMAGANIFVMYAASANNVTVSPRSGKGHFQPGYNPEAEIELLDGTGISNGYMTANVRCNSCLQWSGGSLNTSSTSSTWVWAEKTGPAIASSDPEYSITRHDSCGVYAVNMAQARVATVNETNPFAGQNAASTAQPTDNGGTTTTTSSSDKALIAHAVLMCISFVVLFPSFAISIHIIPSAKVVPLIHAPLQLFTLALVLAGLGLGVYLGINTNNMDKYHPIIGLVVVGMLLLFQPLMGLLQHIHFRRTGGKSVFAYMHCWLGRALIALGIVNGGLGFLLAKNQGSSAPKGAIIAYAVVAGVVGLAYIVFVIVLPFRSKESATAGAKKEVSDGSGSGEGNGLQERSRLSH